MPASTNEPRIKADVAAFLVDREARGLATRTVDFYREKLWRFTMFATSLGVSDVGALAAM